MTVISDFLSLGNVFLVMGLVAFGLLAWRSGFIRYIPNNRIGVVEKLWAVKGREAYERYVAQLKKDAAITMRGGR